MSLGIELALAVVAVLMATATAFLVRWASHARTPLTAAASLFLLAMMAAMFGGAVLYYRAPSGASLVEGLWLASLAMSLSVVPVFLLFVREAKQRMTGAAPDPLARTGPFVAAAVALVLANEFLMGWAFQLASGGVVGGGADAAGAVAFGTSVVNSPWFLFTMALEMGWTTVLLWGRLPRPLSVLLLGQAVVMALSPTALDAAGWPAFAVYGGSAVMLVLIVYLMDHLYRHRNLSVAWAGYALRLLGVYGAMMAGLYLWAEYGRAELFALAVAAEMVVYFAAVLTPEPFAAAPDFPWLLRPRWAFGVMATIFVAELFMGALLDVVAAPSTYASVLLGQPVGGGTSAAASAALQNGFWFVATVTASTWFLLMMGVEMGALVVLKIRESKNLENRLRLGVMITSYGTFAVFFPSVYFHAAFPTLPNGPTVPFLGWSMGIGSAPIAPALFGALLGTYAVTGVLATLFGRRAICSVFCTAPLMFQGTTIDAMKQFNRSSPIGRKYLSSRLSRTYGVTSGVVLGSLFVASGYSYLDATGRASVTIAGADPTVFLFSLYFGVLWYAMFVAIPYAGNYNCVTMGWCYTGTIAQAFQRVGFFKLKVRDRDVCKACTTVDCAKGCPVGLVDMPGHFRQYGEYRSSKCCGVGDCVEACPYGNLYVSDVRHWVAAKLGRPVHGRPVGRLPMVAAPSAAPGRGSGAEATRLAPRARTAGEASAPVAAPAPAPSL